MCENINAATDFFRDVLDFRMTEQILADDGYQLASFMERSHSTHDIAFLTGPDGGFHHVAFWVDDWNELRKGADICAYHGVTVDAGPTRHGATRGCGLYFFDPGRQPQRDLHRRLLVRPRRRADDVDRERDRPGDLLLPRPPQPGVHDGALVSDIRIEEPSYVARYRQRSSIDDGDRGARTATTTSRSRSICASSATARPSGTGSGGRRPERAAVEARRASPCSGRSPRTAATRRSCRPKAPFRGSLNDVFLIRHGETQGYLTDSGLTPQGAWQAHTYGHTLAKRIRTGETVVLRHADTNRARETAEHIQRGLVDGLQQFEKEITIVPPAPMDEFRNFQFVAPDGLKDVTAAFREYYAKREEYERMSTGDRPLWLVEIDRFWKVQLAGGEPIERWLSVPMMHFEPPSMVVRRFWAGINRLSAEYPGARLIIPTHSGCIRAFAVHALGYDPGEPYNLEHVPREDHAGAHRRPRQLPQPGAGAVRARHRQRSRCGTPSRPGNQQIPS